MKTQQLNDEIEHNTMLLNDKMDIVESTCSTICTKFLDKTLEIIDERVSNVRPNIFSLTTQSKVMTLYFQNNVECILSPGLCNVYAFEIVSMDSVKKQDSVSITILDRNLTLRMKSNGLDLRTNHLESLPKSISMLSSMVVGSEVECRGCVRLWFKSYSKDK